MVPQREGIWVGGGYKPIKANFRPSHGAKGCLSGKTPATPKDPLEVLSFHKRTQEPLWPGTRSAINMGTASLRIYVIISSSNYAGELVGNAQPPKKWWWGNWIIRDKTQQRLLRLDYFTDKMWVCATKGCENLFYTNKMSAIMSLVWKYHSWECDKSFVVLMDQVLAVKSFIAQYTSLCCHFDESKQPIELSEVRSSYQSAADQPNYL